MNARQKRFCDEYLIDLNATQAAIRAGYSEKTARQIGEQNLSKLDIREAINAQLERLHSEKTADAREVMEYLTRVMRREEKEYSPQTVMDGGGMSHMTEVPCKVSDANRAAELLGKRYAMFTDNVAATVAMPRIVMHEDGSAEIEDAAVE